MQSQITLISHVSPDGHPGIYLPCAFWWKGTKLNREDQNPPPPIMPPQSMNETEELVSLSVSPNNSENSIIWIPSDSSKCI